MSAMGATLNLVDASADVTINRAPALPGRIVVEQNVETIWSAGATKPDPTWTATDMAGHWHAFDDQGELPTLNPCPRRVGCQGGHDDDDEPEECEGYDVMDWVCRICGDEVSPARLPDGSPKPLPGLKSWTIEMRSDRACENSLVSVRAQTADGLYFGIGYATVAGVDYGPEGAVINVRVAGAGALGYRQHRGERRG